MAKVRIPLAIVRDRSVSGHAHEDIAVTVGSFTHLADSCYLGLEVDNYESTAIDSVMRRMYEQWLSDLRAMAEGGDVVLFPVSLQDEGSLWITSEGDTSGHTAVAVLSTDLEAWRFNASEYHEVLDQVRSGRWYVVGDSRFECSLVDLIQAVGDLLVALDAA